MLARVTPRRASRQVQQQSKASARQAASRFTQVARASTRATATKPTVGFSAPVLAKTQKSVFAPATVAKRLWAIPALTVQSKRFYSGGDHKLSEAEVTERVVEVVKGFPKVDAAKVTPNSSFADLGLDSLDAVELVMALEDNFVIEIPDAEAEKIQTVRDAINYLITHPHAK